MSTDARSKFNEINADTWELFSNILNANNIVDDNMVDNIMVGAWKAAKKFHYMSKFQKEDFDASKDGWGTLTEGEKPKEEVNL